MRPARAVLVQPLKDIFRGPGQTESARSLAATILASFAQEDSDTLTELLLDANARQFPVILGPLSRFRERVAEQLGRLIQAAPQPGAKPEERFQFVQRQANAAIALFHWGESDSLWPKLRHSDDPLLRSYLIDRLPRLIPDPFVVVNRLDAERDVCDPPGTDPHPGRHPRRSAIPVLGGPGSSEVTRIIRG